MKNDTVKRVLGILAMAAAAAVLIVVAILTRGDGASEKDGSGNSLTMRDFAMGSALSVTLYGEADQLESVSQKLMEKIRDLDENVISWRSESSELAKWNRTAKEGEKVQISNTLCKAVSSGILLWEKSGYVLDLTIRPLLDVWGIESGDPGTFQVPTKEELEAAAEHFGMWEIYAEEKEMSRGHEDIVLDLGAVGKGYALDIAYDFLTLGDHSAPDFNVNELRSGRESTVTGGVLAVGGSVMVFGNKPEGGGFQVGVRDPEGQPDDILGTLTLSPGAGRICVSTSGGYEKYIEKDGVRYHHIIDPRTLKPADSGLKSVTVVCENGLVSDGLSTALFILGEDDIQELLEYYHAEAVFVREDGSVSVTDGLKDAWHELK